MMTIPSTVNEAIAYVWDTSDTELGTSEKQSLVATLAQQTNDFARRFSFAPDPRLWVGTLKELLIPTV